MQICDLFSPDISTISRSLPQGFKEDQPNLIVCPSGILLFTYVYIIDIKTLMLSQPCDLVLKGHKAILYKFSNMKKNVTKIHI